MGDLICVDANTFHNYALDLGKRIYDSDWKPDVLVGVWRGGTPIAIAIQEYLNYFGWETTHFPIKTDFYTDEVDTRKESVDVLGLDFFEKLCKDGDKTLLVDDVWDTGGTMKELLSELNNLDLTLEVRIATVFFKPGKNKTNMKPDYFVVRDDRWIYFPHELLGLSLDEIKKSLPHVYERLPNNKK